MTPAAPAPAAAPGRVLVLGAGRVGCYLGGCLQAAGAEVDLVLRPSQRDELRAHGLLLTDLHGRRTHVPGFSLKLHTEPPLHSEPALVLLCVKRGALPETLQQLASRVAAGTQVLCWQNGLFDAEAFARTAPLLNALPGTVMFNVARRGPGHFHQGTAGSLLVQQSSGLEAWTDLFQRAGLPLSLQADMRPVQWGKLLLNLNNPVNALSGLPLRAQLLSVSWRRRTAGLVEEALRLLQAAGIEPARLTPVSWRQFVRVLRLPTPLFRLLAARMLRMDAHARSSMADDWAAGRPTEVDDLCGEVVRLAHSLGRTAPLNAQMLAEIQQRGVPPEHG